MGFFDSLFGGGKKAEAPKKAKKAAPAAVETAPAAAEDTGVKPEVIAAIGASIDLVLEGGLSAELVAAIAAACVHSQGGAYVPIKHTSNVWAASGRQKIMDSRQF